MKQETQGRAQKIKNNMFSVTDILEIDVIYNELLDKKYSNNFNDLVKKTNFLDKLESIIMTGSMWKFNPTCIILFVKDNVFDYNRSSLENDVLENAEIFEQEIDVNKNLYTLIYTVRFLMCNAKQLDSKIIDEPDYATVESTVGDITI